MLDHARRMLTDCQRELVEVKSERDGLLHQQAAVEDERLRAAPDCYAAAADTMAAMAEAEKGRGEP
jgi:hypothetical protein